MSYVSIGQLFREAARRRGERGQALQEFLENGRLSWRGSGDDQVAKTAESCTMNGAQGEQQLLASVLRTVPT